MSGCTAARYGDHDYSRPPHSTAEAPRDVDAEDPCHAGLGGCQDEARYLVTVYQPGTHEWIRMRCCVPCTAQLRAGPHPAPGSSTGGIARIAELRSEGVACPWAG